MSANIIRGQIEQGKIFYMYGVNKDDELLTQLSLTTGSSKKYYFYLCLSRVATAKGFYHRIFWSCDPNDFVFNANLDHANNGPLEFVYEKVNGQYKLFYITTLNNDPANTTRTRYGMNVNFGEFVIANNSAFTFNIIQDTSGATYNIASLIYTDIPYNITANNNNIKPSWIFRKNNTSSGGKPSFGNIGSLPTPTGSNVGDFQNLDSIVAFSGGNTLAAPINTITELYLEINNPTLNTDVTVPTSGTLFITEVADNEAVIYDSLIVDGTTYRFNLTERGAFNTTAAPHLAGVNVQIYDRQNKDNFWFENETLIDVNDEFFMYFLPKEQNLFFPKGHTLSNETTTITATDNIVTYDYIKGSIKNNINNSIIFFANSVYNTLPSVYDFDLTVDNYSQSGIYTETQRTVFLFTNFLDAQQNYFYNYCTINQTCGNCLGSTRDKKNICTVTSSTNERYTNGSDNILSSDVFTKSAEIVGTNLTTMNNPGMFTTQHPEESNSGAYQDNVNLPMYWGLPSLAFIIILAIISYGYSNAILKNITTNAMDIIRRINITYYFLMAIILITLLTTLGIFIGERSSLNIPTINFSNKDTLTDGQVFNYINLAGFCVSFFAFIALLIIYFGFIHVRESESIHQGIQGKPAKTIDSKAFVSTYLVLTFTLLSYIAVAVLTQIYYEKISSRDVCEETIVYGVMALIIIVLTIYLGVTHSEYNKMNNNNNRNINAKVVSQQK